MFQTCVAAASCDSGSCPTLCYPIACNGAGDCDGGACIDGGCAPGCASNADCHAGFVCESGVCTDPCTAPFALCSGACADTSRDNANCGGCGHTCASPQTCDAGGCWAPASPGCQTDIDCPSSQVCRGGVCEPVITACGNGCDAGNECYYGACDPHLATCQTDLDCHLDQRCDPNTRQCVAITASCTVDFGCAAGEVCNPKFDRCVHDPCATMNCATNDAGSSLVCDSLQGVCLAYRFECSSSRPCPAGSLCNPYTSQCVADHCVQSPCTGACDPFSGRCIAPPVSQPSTLCKACRSSADCSNNGLCLQYTQTQSFCGQGCSADGGIGCPAGYTCVALGSAGPDQCINNNNACP